MTIRRAIAAACVCAAAFAGCTYRPAEDPGGGEQPPGARRGGALVFAVADDAGIFDPQLAAQPGAFALVRATQRGLMAFPAATAENDVAMTPVPDLAARAPEISADGTLVTFTLREGVAFGPPASRPLRAADVKAGIERIFRVGSPLASAFEVIAGAADFAAGRAQTISGIETPDERTVRFRLTGPANDLTWMLAHTAASAVPAGTPPAIAPKDLPPSGPYRIERVATGRETRLVRNEAWTPDSDPVRGAYVDEILVRVGPSASADLTGDQVPPPSGATIREVDGGCLLYLFIRPEGPFAERNARAAVSVAIDRSRLVADAARAPGGFSGRPAASLLPPIVLGAPDARPPAGDPAQARRLAGGPIVTRLGRETSGPDAAVDAVVAASIERMLAAAGIRATSFTVAPPGSIYEPYEQGRVPMGLARWCPDWPGRAVRTMVGALAGSRGPANYSGTRDATLDALVQSALTEKNSAAIPGRTAFAATRALSIATLVPVAFLPDRVALSARVRGFEPHPFFVRGDPANVWLEEPVASPVPAPSLSPPGGASSIAVRYTLRVPTTNGGVT